MKSAKSSKQTFNCLLQAKTGRKALLVLPVVLLSVVLWPTIASAQVSIVIGTGDKLAISGDMTLTVSGNWQNNGIFEPGNGTVAFNGSGTQTITNAAGETFNNLTVDKPSGDLQLNDNATVNGSLSLPSGDLDLNGNVVTLGANANLNETPGNTVKGTAGHIVTTRTLNAPSALNVAGLGFEITTAQNLGSTQIIRAHGAQTVDGNTSILRYFDINPTNNTGLNADLVFHYDDSELNGLAEPSIGLFRSIDNGASWILEQKTVDAGNNTISLSGVEAFSRWTASQTSQTFTVNSTNDVDDGTCNGTHCSLREAINAANLNIGFTDIIEFNISGAGPHTIQPASALPTITDAVIIDGTTEPDFAGTPVIELDGTNAGAGTSGLVITAANSTVRGLVINRFSGGGNGIVLNGAGATNNRIEGNFIGTNVSGTSALGNNGGISILLGASNNIIGGTSPTERNVISGNLASGGVNINGSGSDGNQVLGNYIGVDVTGANDLGNSGEGVKITEGTGNIIGGLAPGSGNVISGNGTYGVNLNSSTGTGGNFVQGNFIGTNAAGSATLGNDIHGILIIDSPNNVIGGTSFAARNVISGNGTNGIKITFAAATGNQVQGNFIGTDITSKIALPNIASGVEINSASNTVGGTVLGARNVISGNNQRGIYITGTAATSNTIQGNYIGTDSTGAAALGNNGEGILIEDASGNTVGGTATGAGNVISGNNADGVQIVGATTTNNTVSGNFIGTKANGIDALGNGFNGVAITAPNNTIGGTTPAARNIISGNTEHGVLIQGSGATGNRVQSNFIGVDMTGTSALGNKFGVVIFNAPANIIGGTTAGAGNVIAGNTNDGIQILDSGATGNVLQGNFIGTDASGTIALGNIGNGIRIDRQPGMDGPTDNSIGGSTAGAGNTIAFNGLDGVFVGSGTGNAILSNSIFSNTALGIELGLDGVTANDPGDGDTGANNLQNFPELNSADFNDISNIVTIDGTINSTPGETFTLDFFANNVCDPSGNGEGETFLGSAVVTTDVSGNVSFSETFPITSSTGRILSATATDTSNNTSEFSQCLSPDISVPPGYVSEVFATGLAEPQGVAFDAGGQLIVAATGSGEIFRYDDAGTRETLGFNFNQPSGVAVDNSQILYVSEFGTGNILSIDLNGSVPVDANSLGPVVTGLDGPTYLSFGPTGDLYVSVTLGTAGEKVLRIDLAGPTVSDFVNFAASTDVNPQGLAFDKNGDMYVALQLTGQVLRVPATQTAPSDASLLPVALQGLNSPGGIGFGTDDRLYVATSNQIAVRLSDSQAWTIFTSGLGGGSSNSLVFSDIGQLFTADQTAGRILFIAAPQEQVQDDADFPLSFKINDQGDPSIPGSSDLDAIRNAFQTWGNISTSTVAFTDSGLTTLTNASATDGVNLITFSDTDFLFAPGVLAVTAKTIELGAGGASARILDADVVFNPFWIDHPKFNFGTNDNPGEFDIESIAMHEIGHLLGLVHTGVTQSTMFFVLQPGIDARDLEQDDISWVSHLYPDPSFDTTFGSISGNIQDGQNPGSSVAGALVLAINPANGDSIHAYSDQNGGYLVPGLPPGNYNVFIQPLDGDVSGFPMTAANVSAYILAITNNIEFPEEFFNGQSESDTDDPTESTPVTVTAGAGTSGINFVTNRDLTPPQIVGVFPEDAANGVSIKTEIIINFSEPIDANSMINSFTLNDGSANVDGGFTFLNDDQTAIFTPEDDLAHSTNYTINISTGLTDVHNNALTSAFSRSFSTESADIDAPTVEQIIPADASMDVFVTSKIVVIFSEPIDVTTLSTGFSVTASTSAVVSGSFTFQQANKVVNFLPDASLDEGETYTVTLTQDIRDASGNQLASVVPSNFTTVTSAAPVVIDIGPADNATGVSVTSPVLADFSEPMDIDTFDGSTFVVSNSGVPVAGTFEFLNGDSRIVFRPEGNLNFSSQYTVTITTSVTDLTDLALQQDFSSTFTTANQPVQPAIFSLDPPAAIVGTVVIINGEGFDPNPLNNTVTFNGVTAPVTKATINSLTTEVPLGATTGIGPVIVTVVGNASNAANFQVLEPNENPNNEVVAKVNTDSDSRDADVTPDGTLAYVTNSGSNSVSVIDLDAATPNVITSISVGDTPLKIAINPRGTLAYVTNFGSNNVSVIDIDPTSSTYHDVIATIPVGINPIGIVVTRSRVYVANFTSQDLSVIDADPTSGAFNDVVARVNTDSDNRDVDVSPDGTLAFVTGTTLVIINIDASDPTDNTFNQVIARVNTDSDTRDVDVTPDGTLAIVTTADGNILIIDVFPKSQNFSKVVARVNTDSDSRDLDVSPDGTLVYVTNFDSNDVSVFQFVFVPGANTNGVSVTTSDTNPVLGTQITLKLVDSIPVGDSPQGIVIDPQAEQIVVVNSGSADVSIISISERTPEEVIAGAIVDTQELLDAPETPKKAEKHLAKAQKKLEKALDKLQKGDVKKTFDELRKAMKEFEKAGKEGVDVSRIIDDLVAVSQRIAQDAIDEAQQFAGDKKVDKELEKAEKEFLKALEELAKGKPEKAIEKFKKAWEHAQKAIDKALNKEVGDSDTSSPSSLPKVFSLNQNYPNPFNPTTTLQFSIPASAASGVKVELNIYNILGQLVATLVNEEKLPGRYTVSWDGNYDNGRMAASGVYMFQLKAGDFVIVRKMLLLK